VAGDKNFDLKVGIFVGIGIVLFFVIVFSIGDIKFVKSGYKLSAMFSFIDGLTESAPVRYAGVNVGHISEIKILFDEGSGKTMVRVTAWITDEGRRIEKDSTVIINTLGLLGEKYLEIFPGSIDSGIAQEGDSLVGKDPIMMSDVTDTLNELADSAKVVIDRLKDGEGTVGKLLVDETIYNNLEEFVQDIKAHPWKLLHKPRTDR